MSLTVKSITVYPVKSLAGIKLDTAEVLPTGLKYDRNWVIVDHRNKFVTQRQFPKMATIVPHIENDFLYLKSSASESIPIPLASSAPQSEKITIWKDECDALPVSKDVDDWLTNILATKEEQRFRLMQMKPGFDRKVGTRYLPKQEASLLFADACPFLLTFTGSLNALNSALDYEMPMNRFRPNIVVESSEPWQEYEWKGLRTNSIQFDFIGPCQRCPMTSVDQANGEVVTPGEPLQTLMKNFPVGAQKLPFFGQHAKLSIENSINNTNGTTISVGQKLDLIS